MVRGHLEYVVPKSDRNSHFLPHQKPKHSSGFFCPRKVFRCIFLAVFLIIVIQVVQLFVNIQYHAIPHILMKSANNAIELDTWEQINIPMSSVDNRGGYGRPRLQCQCETNRSTHLQGSLVEKGRSSCSQEATEFGTNQRVISYSLFVPEVEAVPFFLNGIVPTLKNLEDIFPGWLTRIYTNIPINNRSCSFICEHDTLFWCDITNIPVLGDLSAVNGRVWRFLPIGDPTVDIFLSRDLDSSLSIRERIAVSEYEASNKTFHVMRDSQWHHTEILAGLWGAKNYLLPPKVSKWLQSLFIIDGKKSQEKGLDQKILRRSLFYPYRQDILAHDSYFCGQFEESKTLPFSTRRVKQEFVGHDDLKEIGKLLVGRLKPCPVECRPSYGKDWAYC